MASSRSRPPTPGHTSHRDDRAVAQPTGQFIPADLLKRLAALNRKQATGGA